MHVLASLMHVLASPLPIVATDGNTLMKMFLRCEVDGGVKIDTICMDGKGGSLGKEHG